MDCGSPGAAAPRRHSHDAALLIGLTPDIATDVVQRAADEFEESLEILKMTD